MMDANEIIEQCAKLAHLLLVRDFQYPNTANVIADAIRALKTPQMTQVELTAQDAVLHGTGYMQAGKRIDPSEVYRPMTALTQSELDTLQQEINAHVSTLNVRITQLTAERYEKATENVRLSSINEKLVHDFNTLLVNDSLELDKRQARIAELEAALLKSDALQDLAYANGAHYALVASNGGAPEAKIMAMISDRRHSSLVELKRLRENPSIAALEAQPSAQFVAGMRRAADIARNACLVPPDGGEPTEDEARMCNLCAAAILAEAALKGEGE